MKLLAALPLLLPAVHAKILCGDFRLKVVADLYPDAVVLKSMDYPHYYVVNILGGSGEIFEFGDGSILVDSEQQSVIVSNSGDLRVVYPGQLPTPGFSFDDNNNLKLKRGDFYACKLYELGITRLKVGYEKGCTKVELVKAPPAAA